VNIYIEPPPGKHAADFDIKIGPNKLCVGLKQHNCPFIDEQTYSKVNTSESSWYFDSAAYVIHIILMKALRGETWEGALKGRDDAVFDVDPMTVEQMKQQMMLERFQEENPGFDFRDATFNGTAPDPRTFMGGISYR